MNEVALKVEETAVKKLGQIAKDMTNLLLKKATFGNIDYALALKFCTR